MWAGLSCSTPFVDGAALQRLARDEVLAPQVLERVGNKVSWLGRIIRVPVRGHGEPASHEAPRARRTMALRENKQPLTVPDQTGQRSVRTGCARCPQLSGTAHAEAGRKAPLRRQ